ncbi:Glycosyltransferase sugar-binding region containing DXD motif [Geosmithia morbida]|uniref:Glycosyltransferase sugar-binding region containing DXD motif n=1 Tax=Geosmithia morbida TaxID=1094350 RepID=A0A9P5D1P4_9HYPO|nr:Glycosyltransferase sugar-binding region containing DXD motif [Geosmithia morbida]KAF4120676.1 Glycosyltransferase sugar-binding region containing DXD motif [Geosmithia morbida]
MLDSPLASPRLAASKAAFRNRVPTRVKRCLPLYLGCVLFLALMLNLDVLYSLPSSSNLHRREKPVSHSLQRGHTFPRKIWQTWKTEPLMFGVRDTVRAMSWFRLNPQMRYEVITDSNEMSFVEQHFGPQGLDRQDIVDFYRSLKLQIVKADLLRYMVMYAEGGIYADIDVQALRPFERFLPNAHDENDFDLIIGIEVDEPGFRDHPILGQKSQSFCQWTIISRPRHPVMMRLIEDIMAWMEGMAQKQGKPISEVELTFDEVITGTGPSAFTRAVMAEMNRKSPRGKKVTWDDFHGMTESKVVGRVLVLTVEAFCAGQGHSDSGNHQSRNALVQHHYHASDWPSKHPRYYHPAYGQVEECNWNAECVRQWDENVAAYEHLSEEEKLAKNEERRRALEALFASQ